MKPRRIVIPATVTTLDPGDGKVLAVEDEESPGKGEKQAGED